MKVSIIGTGCVGRVMALTLLSSFTDIEIYFFDQAKNLNEQLSCGYAAAGMVAPYCECVTVGELQLYTAGINSLALWPQILHQTGRVAEQFKKNGTLVLAHLADAAEFEYFKNQVTYQGLKDSVTCLSVSQVKKVEPALNSHQIYPFALYMMEEGCVNVPVFFSVTTAYFNQLTNVHFHQQLVENIQQFQQDNVTKYDYIIDARGLGATGDIANLRGVRGESIIVEASNVQLRHTIRLMHPRHPLYITPRGNHIYYIGATSIESNDHSAISVKSTLELLSALYMVDSGFAEARILKLLTHVRPVLNTGLPIVKWNAHQITINGLSRHGYLLSPDLCQKICHQISKQQIKAGSYADYT